MQMHHQTRLKYTIYTTFYIRREMSKDRRNAPREKTNSRRIPSIFPCWTGEAVHSKARQFPIVDSCVGDDVLEGYTLSFLLFVSLARRVSKGERQGGSLIYFDGLVKFDWAG